MPIIGAVLDPTQASGPSLGPILSVLEPLVRFQGGEIKPLLASSYKAPDANTYVFTISDGAAFSDGSPFGAEDAAFSLGLQMDPARKSLNASLFALVDSAKVTGAREVTVKLKEPDPQFLSNIAQIGMVSKAFYAKVGAKVGTKDVMNLGTGPYQFTAFTPSRSVTLGANVKYWGGEKPTLKTITTDVVSDDAARLSALQSGEYDGIFAIPLPQVDAVKGVSSLTVSESADLSVYKFNLNVKTPPWDDIHLRRAFELGVNRQAIATGALGGKVQLAPTIVPQRVMATLAGEAETQTVYDKLGGEVKFDLDAARAELAQSSRPKGVSVDILVTGSDPTLGLVAQTAAQDLRKIGINLKVREVDDGTYYRSVYFEHKTDGVSIDLFSGSAPDASNLPTYILSGANTKTEGGSGTNISDYINPAIDRLLASGRLLPVDDPQRGGKLLEALSLAQADVPYVPLAFPNVYMAGRKGLNVSQLDSFWWLARWPEIVVRA